MLHRLPIDYQQLTFRGWKFGKAKTVRKNRNPTKVTGIRLTLVELEMSTNGTL